ncbi:MAG: hypothetical protein Q7V53_00045 [Caldisericota bacterium]|nr:hypothetical protein [Caldisericota bacterium]
MAELQYELVSGIVRNNFVPDPVETYSIDYGALNSALKTTNASVTLHPNGMIKAVNADVDDRSAQVLSSLGSTVLNLYKASTLSFVPTGAQDSSSTAKTCGKFIDDKLAQRRELLDERIPKAKGFDEALEADKKAADAAALELESASAKLAEAQKAKDEPAIAALTPKIPAFKAELAVALKKLEGRTLQGPELKAKLDAVTRALTVTLRKSAWAPVGSGAEICTVISANQADYYNKLASVAGEKANFNVSSATLFTVDACVMPQPNSRRANAPASNSPRYAGVVYRMPASGSVWIRNSKRHDERIDATGIASLPQFGAKGLIWLENTLFDKNNVKVGFNEDGSMNELSFGAQSRAERGVMAASDVSGTVVELMKLRADAIKARAQAVDDEQKKVQQKQLDAIDDQIALLQKRKDLEVARLPTKDAHEKQKEQLQKEIELERLRQELAELKKNASPP